MALPVNLTVIIPSIGYPTLARTLESIGQQELRPGDQVFVIGDGPQPESRQAVRDAVTRYGFPFAPPDPIFRYREITHVGDWGNTPRNWALDFAGCTIGNWLVWMDEDDVFLPMAFEILRERAAEAQYPFMVKGIWPDERIVWWEPRIERCYVGGHNFVCPVLPGQVGRWGTVYEGDFDFIRSTLDCYGDDTRVRWFEDLISDHRPHLKGR